MLPFLRIVESEFAAVNKTIIEQLHSDVDLVENIGHYIVDAGGKRLRPVLVLLVGQALGYRGQAHISLAAIIEFIHTATLLHDDVVDISSLRRGRATANATWGNAPSVLVGDFLYSRAFQMLVALGQMPVMAILSNTTNVIAEGEVQQLVNARDASVDEARYFTVIHKKTAALFEAAAEAAAVVAGAEATICDSARQFGHHLGMAFQIVDDVLDYEGDAAELGKNIGDDLAEGKPTLPLIHAMKVAPAHDAQHLRNAITEADRSAIDEVIRIVREHDSLTYCRQQAEAHCLKALDALNDLRPSPYKEALDTLARFSINRTF